MESLDYLLLYSIQDHVLEIVSRSDTSFYLTGGTCLNRFYFERRYSADLDLFSNENNIFREDIRFLLDAFQKAPCQYEVLVDTRDFVRLLVRSALKVDFVNDRVYRFGRSCRNPKGIVLDNTVNIAANKICAVLGRDEPKDVFDLYTLYCDAGLDWEIVLSAAGKKCSLDMEILEYRLKSFPLKLVDLLSVVSRTFIDDFKRGYKEMIAAICKQ
jgi:predicted nucleotidyltransferase component of viral defense system